MATTVGLIITKGKEKDKKSVVKPTTKEPTQTDVEQAQAEEKQETTTDQSEE